MRKIQHYVVKETEIFVGLEDSKRSWKVVVRGQKRIVHSCSMPAQYSVLSSFFRNRFPECTIRVLYEAGFRGFGLRDRLVEDGHKCDVIPPHLVTEEKCNRKKNDRTDARRLAKICEDGGYGTCFVFDHKQRSDRHVSRLYGQVDKDTVRARNRIRRALEWNGLDEHFKSGPWSEGDYSEVLPTLEKMSLPQSLRFHFRILYEQLQSLRAVRKTILKEFARLREDDAYKDAVRVYRSTPGIGPLTAIRLALEWGDLRRFKTKEQFSSYLGLTPSDHSTGETERKGHITKQGNRGVRKWLIESSWVAIRKDPVLLDKFNRVRMASGSQKKAIVAVARKLGLRLRALLLNNECYECGVVE